MKLQYRKFDTTYMQHVYGEGLRERPADHDAGDRPRDLPDRGRRPVAAPANAESTIRAVAALERLRHRPAAQGRQGSERASCARPSRRSSEVEKLGPPDGPLNLARVYLQEGRLDDARSRRSSARRAFDPPAPRWTVAWLTGLVNKQNGYLDEAIAELHERRSRTATPSCASAASTSARTTT